MFLYFTKVVVIIRSLMNNVFNLEEHLQPWIVYIQYIWQIFLFKDIVISKEHLQPYIWMVPSLFQKATCSDLRFSRVLCFFEISTCNHPCFQRYWINSPFQLQPSIRRMAPFFYHKRAVAATHSFKFTLSFQNRRSCSKEILYLSTMIPPWFQACIIERSPVIWQHRSQQFVSSICFVISWERFKRSIMSTALDLFHNTYCNHPL